MKRKTFREYVETIDAAAKAAWDAQRRAEASARDRQKSQERRNWIRDNNVIVNTAEPGAWFKSLSPQQQQELWMLAKNTEVNQIPLPPSWVTPDQRVAFKKVIQAMQNQLEKAA